MNKKIVAIVVAVVLVLACAVGAYMMLKPKTTAAPTTVTIWHTFTDAQQEALTAFANEFNESQSEYVVEVQEQAYSGFLDSVYQAVANGVGPNIIINYASTAAEYVKDNLVVDLAPYINDAEIGMADVYNSLPDTIKAETVGFEDGGMHALPAVTTGPILFINKTLYDELGLQIPTTWEQLAENSKAIYEAKGIAGFAADSKTDLLQSIFMQTGAEYIDLEAKEIRFDTEENIAWLDWYAENVKAGYFAHNSQSDYFSSDFNAQLVACYLGSCAGYPYIVPDGFEYVMAPMPNTIDVAWYPSWNRGPIVFNKTDAENKGAYLFVKYFMSPEVNARWAIAMNALSPYGTTQATEAYAAFAADLHPSLVAVQDNIAYAGATPTVTGSQQVRDAVDAAATAVAGGKTGAEAMAACAATSNAALQGK